jgi:hypothetical protein
MSELDSTVLKGDLEFEGEKSWNKGKRWPASYE